jgi:hypothetical protein
MYSWLGGKCNIIYSIIALSTQAAGVLHYGRGPGADTQPLLSKVAAVNVVQINLIHPGSAVCTLPCFVTSE